MTRKADSRHDTPTTRRSQVERTAATTRALLDAGRQLFAARGYAGAGREEIVALAGVTRGALYHHFGDKLGLFKAVVEEVEADVTDQIAAAVDFAAGDARQALIDASLHFLDAATDPAVRRIMLDASAVLDWQEWRAIREAHGLGLTKLALTTAMEAGVIDPQPVDPLAHMLLAALNEAATLVSQADDPAATRSEVGHSIEWLLNRF